MVERETKRARLCILLAITANETSSASGLMGRMGDDLVASPLSLTASRRRARRREYVVTGLRDEKAMLEMMGVGRRDEVGVGVDDDAAPK